jgi:glutathione S-transferase
VKLFYAPGACSLAAHIVLEEIGRPFEAVGLDLMAGDQRKADYLALNPKGRVPLLVTEAGALTESVAILGFLADSAPQQHLLPTDPWARAQALSLLAWLSGTVHGIAFASIFRPARFSDDETAFPAVKAKGLSEVNAHLATMNARLSERDYAFDHFTIADPYFLILRRWAIRVGVDVVAHTALTAHAERLAARPAVQRALAREGIRIDA